MKITVAVVQFGPKLADIDLNIMKINGLLDQVRDARLIVLPELAVSGYNFSSFEEAYDKSEPLESGSYVQFLVDKAREKNAYIVSGVNERVKNQLYNTAVTIGPQGIISVYRKIHLFMNEKDIFQPGSGDMRVVDLGGFKAGMLICFDYLFPEIWRMQAVKGADIICHPSNLLTQNAQRCIPGLALMNRIFVLTANRTGSEGDLHFNGQSFITDPHGNVLMKASPDKDEILTASLDLELSRNKWVTSRNHAFYDRRPEVYQ
jgi:predicted amidohydrolase